MAKLVNGTKVVAVRNSVKGFYSVGMTGVVNDYRVSGNEDEYLVAFDGRAKRVWTSAKSILEAVIFNSGDRVIATKDSPKGLYVAGMTGTVEDHRYDDGLEYKVDFDAKSRKTWVMAQNLDGFDGVDVVDDEDCIRAILLSDQDDLASAGDIVKIFDEGFGYYTVLDEDDDCYDVEKQDVFIIPENKPLYVHILDLRKLRELGCEFGSDSRLRFTDDKGEKHIFLSPDDLDMIDKSFVVSFDADGEIYFEYNGHNCYIRPYEISNGLVEFRD